MRSIKTQLTFTLLVCILLPTGLIAASAYWLVFNTISEQRINDVEHIADERYQAMRMQLQRDNERGARLLESLIAACGNSDFGVNNCAQVKLQQFAAINGVAGFSFHSGVENDLALGSEPISVDQLARPFLPEQLAAIVKSKINNASLYSLVAIDSASGMSLVTTYSAKRLQDIFVGSPRLGQSGETFLADSQGFFVTQPRYLPQQGVSEPISAVPMQHCLRQENGKMLGFDYRNVAIIHGFRFVPEIGGGCIMAHVDQAEAFAQLKTVTITHAAIIVFFVFLSWLLAAFISRNITHPIAELTDMAQALSGGNFAPRYLKSKYKEINKLSQLFNSMAKQLENTISQLLSSEQELEKKVAQRTVAFNAQNRKYFSVLHATGDGFWLVDKEARLLEANPAYARFSGYAVDELVGMRVADLEANETPAEIAAHIRKVIAHGSDLFETRHRRKDGSLWDVEINVSFLNSDAGYFIIFLRDITGRKQMVNALKESHCLLQTVIETAPVRIFWKDRTLRYLGCNTVFAHDAGEQTSEDVIGKDDFQLGWKARAKRYLSDDRQVLEGQAAMLDFEEQQITPDGRLVWLKTSKTALRNEAGDIVGILGVYSDITKTKHIEQELRVAAVAFESTDCMLITDNNGVILKVNQAFIKSTGYTEAEILGQTPRLLKSGRHDGAFYRAMWESINGTGSWQGEIWDRRKNGEIYPKWLNITAVKDAAGKVSHYVGTHTDITERKAAEDEIKQLAFYDPLTLLPNRRLLQERLQQSINATIRDGKQFALLMLDLDRFKMVNDSLGHLAGDELLQQVAERISKRLRDVDTVARLGGDEFVVLLAAISKADDAARVSKEIIADLTRPFNLAQSDNIQIGASIGISLYPQHGGTPETLMDHADAALYLAKDAGRGCFAYFSKEMTVIAQQRMAMEKRLRSALKQQELRIFYQPQVDVASGRIVGAEALVRWQDPNEGLLQPASFIGIAEETGLIVEIGAWVLQEACRQGRQWLDAGLPLLSLAVNISPYQFRRSNICALVAKVLSDTGFPASHLELEITETGLMENQNKTDAILTILNNLRVQGVHLAIDDFGTGYSSLAYLKHFPLNVLKIDRSFIEDIPFHQDDMEIASSIVSMGHTLGLKIMAEGVETQEQLDFLRDKGCDGYQGFFKSKAVPAKEFSRLLRDQQQKG